MGSVVLDAIADNTIFEDSSLSNGKGNFIFAGNINHATERIRRGLIKFDIASSLPAGAQVTSVTLSLHLFKIPPSNPNVDISLHRTLNDWGEGESNSGGGGRGYPAQPGDTTWIYKKYDTERWDKEGGDFSSDASATITVGDERKAYSWSSKGMVADVKAWLANPSSNFGWFLLGIETSQQTARGFGSQYYPNTTERPKLTIEFD